jgi:hypothetical protein
MFNHLQIYEILVHVTVHSRMQSSCDLTLRLWVRLQRACLLAPIIRNKMGHLLWIVGKWRRAKLFKPANLYPTPIQFLLQLLDFLYGSDFTRPLSSLWFIHGSLSDIQLTPSEVIITQHKYLAHNHVDKRQINIVNKKTQTF